MPPPLILLTLPPPLNAQPWPIKAPLPLVCWRLSSCLSLICRLFATSPVVTFLRLASPFVAQLPHASILDPTSLFAPAGCRVASLRTSSASRRAAASRLSVSLPSPMRRHLCRRCDCDCHPRCIPSSWRHRPRRRRRRVVVVVSRRTVTMVIVVVNVARCAVAIIIDFAVRRAVAVVVVASLTSSSPVAPAQ